MSAYSVEIIRVLHERCILQQLVGASVPLLHQQSCWLNVTPAARVTVQIVRIYAKAHSDASTRCSFPRLKSAAVECAHARLSCFRVRQVAARRDTFD